MDSTSTEFEVPRGVQKAAAFGGLVIDAYLAAHESRQARIGAPQSGPKRPPFAEVLKQAGSSIPGLQDALVALAGEENVADFKKLAELVGENPDLAELVRKATMNARGVGAPAPTSAPNSARPAGSGEDLRAALGAALARGEEADSRAQLLAMLRSSVEERLTLMDARLNGRVSALQQRVIHLEASIDGLAQDIERLKQRARERRDAAPRAAPAREPSPTALPDPLGSPTRPHDPAPESGAAATAGPKESTASSAETSTASPRVESAPTGEAATTTRVEAPAPASPDTRTGGEQTGPPRRDVGAGTPDVVGPAATEHGEGISSISPPASRGSAPARAAAIHANEPAAADAGADQLLMSLLDAHESDHDARITEGENAVANLERHVVTLTAQVRELTELHNDA
jgi:hypothetical protein